MLSLKLQNYRRFIETDTITCPPGLTIIGGPNGAGKSTLVEAVLFALFGPEKGQAQDIRPDNVGSSDETLVECSLLINEIPVRIRRSDRGVRIWVRQDLVADGGTRLGNKALAQLIGGLSREQFERTYIALQGDTAGLVETKTKEQVRKRREIIERVLRLDALRAAAQDQEERKKEALTTVKGEANSAIDDLTLGIPARNALNDFSRALKPEKRAEHGQSLTAMIQAAITMRQRQLDEARLAVAQARTCVQAEQARRDGCQTQVEAARQVAEQHAALREKHLALQGQVDRLGGQIEWMEGEQTRLTSAIEQAEGYASVTQQYEALLGEIERHKLRLLRLPQIRDRYYALIEAKKTVSRLADELKAFDRVDQALTEATAVEAEVRQHWNELQTDPTEAAYHTWLERQKAVELEEKQAREALESLEEAASEAPCPICGQALRGHTRDERLHHLAYLLDTLLPGRRNTLATEKCQLDQQRQQRERDKQAASEAWQEAQEGLSEAKRFIEQRHTLRRQLDEGERASAQAQAAWAELGEAGPYDPQEEAGLKDLKRTLEAEAAPLKGQAESYHRLDETRQTLADLKTKLQTAQGQQRTLIQTQAELGYNAEADRQASNALNTLYEKLRAAQEALGQAETEATRLEGEAQRLDSALQQATRYHERFTAALVEAHREERLHALLTVFQAYFFAVSTRRVADRATDLLRHAVTDQTIRGIRFDDDELIYLDASSHPRPIARLSGGEKALVGLCLRIALAEQAQAATGSARVGFLILDEVLSALDDERREAVQRIFDDVLRRGIFEHIIMITHLDTVKQGWRANQLEVHKVDSKTSQVVANQERHAGPPLVEVPEVSS